MGTLSSEQRRAMAVRAATVYERVRAWKTHPSPAESTAAPADAPGSDPADDVLKSWNRAFSPGDAETFARRLEWDYLDSETVRLSLADTGAGLEDEAVKWTRWIDRITAEGERAAAEERDGLAASGHFKAGEAPPFVELIVPALWAARQALTSEGAQLFEGVASGARLELERPLLRSAGLMSELALLEEFRRFTPVGETAAGGAEVHAGGSLQTVSASLGAAISSRKYAAFVSGMLHGGLAAFYLSYPVLARHVATLADHWVQSTRELLLRLQADRRGLAEAFAGGADPGRVVTVHPAKSDPHDGGRRVSVIEFESGLRVVYKPRDVAIEAALTQFLTWCMRKGLSPAQKTLRVLTRDGYGWVEFAEQAVFGNPAEIARFYEHGGGLMCLMHVLRGRDLHMENVIATAEGPIAIDVELLFQPARRIEDPGEGTAARAGRTAGDDNCLDTGLLSFLQMGPDGEVYDIGALRGARRVAISRPMRVWKEKGFDSIHFADGRQSDLDASSEVRLGDRTQRPEDYAAQITRGFADTYRFLLAHRDELLAPGGPLALFADRPARVVLRATDHYATLIYLLASPAYQADGAARSGALDVLNRVFSRARSRPSIWALAAAEREALERLDIPRFVVPANDTTIQAAGRCVAEGFFVRSGFAEVSARIAGLSEDALDTQLWLLARGLSSSVASRFSSELVRLDPPQAADAPASPVELLAQALWIAGELESRATATADGLKWEVAPAFLHRPAVRQHNLYDGSIGPALFLAALSAVTGDERWKRVAGDAVRPVVSAFGSSSPAAAGEAEIGGCSGLASIVYGLTWIGRLLGNRRLTELAGRVALTITETRIRADRYFDITAGAAGAIAGLLPAWHDLQDSRLLERAEMCGEHLLAHQVAIEGGSAWPFPDRRVYSGFAHGAAGVAHALVRLYRETGRRAFLEGALRAHAFERSLYVPVHRNWAMALPDDRLGVDGLGMTAWCHGAAGIVLARLSLLDIVDDPVFFSQITTALATTGAVAGHGSDHLCCGNMGRSEALLAAGRRLNDEEAMAAARRIVGKVAARAAAKGHFRLTAAGFEYPIFDPGFFRGLSGIGYQFLRMVAPAALPSILTFEDTAGEGGEQS